VELYKAAIKTFVRLLGDHLLRSYSALDIERFKTLRIREVSAVRVNIDFRTTKAFFQKAVSWGFLEKNPFGGVKQIKIPPRRPIYLTKEEFSRLIASIDLPWLKNLVQFAVSTMMRVGEIVNLSWDSVDLQRRLILVENTEEFRIKTTNPRSVPMNDWVFSFVATKANRTGFVFTLPSGHKITVRYASRKFKAYVRIARLPEEIHFHSLRHTGASWLVQDGVSIYAVQKLLGHSNISVTQIYSHLAASELHSAINKISVSCN
jgi:site-specific recombinase XerD